MKHSRYVLMLSYDVEKEQQNFYISEVDWYDEIDQLTMKYEYNNEIYTASRKTVNSLWIQDNVLNMPSFDD